MPLFEVQPLGGGARRAVVVIQEAFGVNSHIEDVTRRFAREGYLAVAPHLFHRTGGGTIPYDRIDLVAPHFERLSDDTLLVDGDAALAHVRGRGFEPERIGLVGFCMGGRVSFLVATRRRIGAAVGFYGGGILHGRGERLGPLAEDLSAMKTPWLGLFGDEDQSIPVVEVEELRARLESAPVDTEIVRYPAAGHGFHCDQRESYHPSSAADAWQRTLDWFDGHLA
ncbi:MAG: dienelactone hydrolase family protein [Actinomycetota bacterium]|nr:dienelactone hydrolase family protein [Actinomycetota bacterium]